MLHHCVCQSSGQELIGLIRRSIELSLVYKCCLARPKTGSNLIKILKRISFIKKIIKIACFFNSEKFVSDRLDLLKLELRVGVSREYTAGALTGLS